MARVLYGHAACARAQVGWPARAGHGDHVMRPRVFAVVLLVVHASRGACPSCRSRPTRRTRSTCKQGHQLNAALGSRLMPPSRVAASSRCSSGRRATTTSSTISRRTHPTRARPALRRARRPGCVPGIAYRLRGGHRGFTWLRTTAGRTSSATARTARTCWSTRRSTPSSGCGSPRGRSCCPTATCWSITTRCGATRVAGARRHAALLHQPPADPRPAAVLQLRGLCARLPDRLRRRVRLARAGRPALHADADGNVERLRPGERPAARSAEERASHAAPGATRPRRGHAARGVHRARRADARRRRAGRLRRCPHLRAPEHAGRADHPGVQPASRVRAGGARDLQVRRGRHGSGGRSLPVAPGTAGAGRPRGCRRAADEQRRHASPRAAGEPPMPHRCPSPTP